MSNVEEILQSYKKKEEEIRKRLQEFKQVLQESDERIFAELAFCLCTPQSKATICWKAVENLTNNNLLLNGSEKEIIPFLSAVRFGERKAQYIIEARKLFTKDGKLDIKGKILSLKDPFKAREWLVENVKGLGIKEASHFLRNIGYSFELAILDIHILRKLKEYGVIKIIPKNLTKKLYLEIEQRMKFFARSIGLSLQELDLLFWSEETGIVFK